METIELKIGERELQEPTEVDAAAHTILINDRIISVGYTVTGIVSIVIPSDFATGKWYPITVKDAGGNAGTNNITVSTEGSEKIDGAGTAVINSDYSAINIYTDGTNYFIY